MYSAWRIGAFGVVVAMGLGTTGWVTAQTTSGAEPGTSPSRVGGAPVTSPNTYEGELGRQSGNPQAAPGSSTRMSVSTPLTTDEKSFLSEVAQANVFQIDAASLAGRTAASPSVKALAQSVLASRARMRMELEHIARERGIALPSALSASQHAELDRLRGLSGSAFDREYVRTALAGNRRSISRFRQAASSTANDRQLRRFAEAQLPALEQNVREARASSDSHRG